MCVLYRLAGLGLRHSYCISVIYPGKGESNKRVSLILGKETIANTISQKTSHVFVLIL